MKKMILSFLCVLLLTSCSGRQENHAGIIEDDRIPLVSPDTANALFLMFSKEASSPVVGGTVTSSFGYRMDPFTNQIAFHTGIDISFPENTPILAVSGGTVLKTGNDPMSGNFIILDHGNDVCSFYAHCSEITVDPENDVLSGQMIGRVGHTGYSTGPHLHFEIWADHVYIDPALLMDSPT